MLYLVLTKAWSVIKGITRKITNKDTFYKLEQDVVALYHTLNVKIGSISEAIKN